MCARRASSPLALARYSPGVLKHFLAEGRTGRGSGWNGGICNGMSHGSPKIVLALAVTAVPGRQPHEHPLPLIFVNFK